MIFLHLCVIASSVYIADAFISHCTADNLVKSKTKVKTKGKDELGHSMHIIKQACMLLLYAIKTYAD